MDNTDDHENSYALVFTDPGIPRPAPAFDMLPACQNPGYQQIVVVDKGAESSLDNALSSHKAFRLSNRQAMAEIKAVAQVVDGWQAHFRRLGGGDWDIELLHSSIDRHFLRDQRQWALR
jgi:serine/threonine-protein kinase HipA